MLRAGPGVLVRLVISLVAMAIAGIGPAAHAETRALLAGVWTFNSPMFPNLKGPENDLTAMETVIRAQGAHDVTVLRNNEVTRTGIETALHALGLRSKPGDWVVFYYTGHGDEAAAAVKGTADGDFDQYIPLAGFDPDRQDPERFIVDKDFYTWMARYIPADVHILMIADTCHSGTLNRSIDPASFGFVARTSLRGGSSQIALVPRPGPHFAPISAEVSAAGARLGAGVGVGAGVGARPIDRPDLANMVYIGGAQDDQVAWEFPLPVNGAPPRGAMTWSLEQGLMTRGPDGKTAAADLDHDGHVTPAELQTYLGGRVRALTAQRQEPRTTFIAAAGDLPLFSEAPPPRPAPPASLPGVFVVASGTAIQGPDTPWRLVTRREEADFVWDLAKAKVFRRSGDMVAEGVSTPAGLRGVIEKWTTVDGLGALLNESKVRITIGPGANGVRYPSDSKISIDLHYSGGTAGYATIFNLASDGTVQRLYPLTDDDGDGQLLPGGKLPTFQNRVIAPYGTDHIVALVLPKPPVALRMMLRGIDGQRLAPRVLKPIGELLAGGGGLSVGEIYTGP